MRKILSFLFILLFVLFLPAQVIFAQSFSGNDLINITQPSIVKIVVSTRGSIEIEDFDYNFDTLSIEEVDETKPLSYDIDEETYGTGFIISQDGYIVTVSHVILFDEIDLYESLAYSFVDYVIDYYPDSEIDKFVRLYPDAEEAYYAFYDIIYNHIVENSVKKFNREISILKPNYDSDDIETLIKNGIKAEVIYSNPDYNLDEKDVAILKIDQNNLPALPLESSGTLLNTGDGIYTFGYPSTAFVGSGDYLEPTFSQGFVNAIKKLKDINYYQVDSKVATGSSGGPLLNQTGEVVGMISMISGDTSDGDNFGFALSLDEIKKVIEKSNINLDTGFYFEEFKQALSLYQDRHCKEAISSFGNILSINKDFSPEKNVRNYINNCEQMIASGESVDSFMDKIISDFELNAFNLILISIILILIVLVIYFKVSLSKRIGEESSELDKVEGSIGNLETSLKQLKEMEQKYHGDSFKKGPDNNSNI